MNDMFQERLGAWKESRVCTEGESGNHYALYIHVSSYFLAMTWIS